MPLAIRPFTRYLRKMLKTAFVTTTIATAIATLVGSLSGSTGCGTTQPQPGVTSHADPDLQPDAPAELVDPGAIARCTAFRCYPDPGGGGGNQINQCTDQCGDIAHCLSYTTDMIVWCANHPDHLYRGQTGMLCDPSGNPLWATRCELGYDPIAPGASAGGAE